MAQPASALLARVVGWPPRSDRAALRKRKPRTQPKTAVAQGTGAVSSASFFAELMAKMKSILLERNPLTHGLNATLTASLPNGGTVTVSMPIPAEISTLTMREVQGTVLAAAIEQIQGLQAAMSWSER